MASVASQNPFAALAEEPETSVKEKEPPAKEPVVVPKKVDRSRAQPKGIRFEYPQRGGHKAPASNRTEDTRSAAPRDRNVGPRLSGRREEGGSGGSGGGSGGGGGGGEYPTRNSRGARPNDRGRGGRGNKRGREYDRHSGTGRYDSEKKENQAWGSAANTWENDDTTESKSWGNKNKKSDSTWENANNNNADGWDNKDTTEENGTWGATGTTTEEKGGANDSWNVTEESTENNNWQDPQPTDSSEAWASGNVEDKPETKKEDTTAGSSAPAPEPEESVKTYDEYLAEKAQKSLEISLPESRKANEGADDSQWKDAVPLEKDDEDEYIFTGKEQSYRNKSKKSKTKNYLEITQTFERSGGGSSRGRGRGRGGRGGGRGRDDREGRDGRIYDDNNRDNRRRGGSGRGVNLDDTRAFPSLGAS